MLFARPRDQGSDGSRLLVTWLHIAKLLTIRRMYQADSEVEQLDQNHIKVYWEARFVY